jgi:hypothetical protein
VKVSEAGLTLFGQHTVGSTKLKRSRSSLQQWNRDLSARTVQE